MIPDHLWTRGTPRNWHGLRHSHAVRLDEAGVRTSLISRQLGHSSLAVTSVYIDHVSPAQLVQALDGVAFDPPAPASDAA